MLANNTEAFGRAEAATTSYTYTADRRLDVTTDPRNHTLQNVWCCCCGWLQGQIDQAGHGKIDNRNSSGDVTHQIWVADLASHSNLHDPIDAKTLQEVTTKFDARHRPIAQTVWLTPRGNVDKNNPPIAGEGGIPAADGLTTYYLYDAQEAMLKVWIVPAGLCCRTWVAFP